MAVNESPKVTIRCDRAVVDEIDDLVEAGRYPSRSEFFREASRVHLRARIPYTEVPDGN